MKFFVISDIHGFYDEMIKALNRAGFDEENPNHFLIALGDYFDRGKQPIAVMRYLRNLERKILIRGNHEGLLEDLCNRGTHLMHDATNGTYETVLKFCNDYTLSFAERCEVVLKRVKPFFSMMQNFFETENYIFVHSWIPLYHKDCLPKYYTQNRQFEFNRNWRTASKEDWENAMWGNPFELAKNFLPDKTIVFGHWHCSAGWAEKENRSEFGEDAKFDIFYGDGFIGIDACTARTKKVNCLVLKDNFI